MTNYAVLGLGMMGEALVYDLLTHDESSVVFGYELNEQRRKDLANKFSFFGERFIPCHLDLKLEQSVEDNSLVQEFKQNSIIVVFGAIDYSFNLFLTKICIQANAHFLDLGGNPSVVDQQSKLHETTLRSNIAVIPDCGLAPGMINIVAVHVMDLYDQVEECHLRVGGLPQIPKSVLKYQQVFSIRGLTNEYLEDAVVIRDGKIQTVPSLTELEEIKFREPYNSLEAFQTAGGTSSLPKLYENKVSELTYKTIRYQGHCQIFQFLKEFELLSSKPYEHNPQINPREVIEYYLERHLSKNEPDVVLARISVIGKKGAKLSNTIYELIDKTDSDTGYSAMARTTAFPISIIGQMLAYGKITSRGVIPGEIAVPKIQFLDELEQRGITFAKQEITL
ncbi:MAG: saccharopine dehydrogenase family protein [Candidatus Kariarchaeaceae archaeon]|jgi:lysine 6-dehydrogenase